MRGLPYTTPPLIIEIETPPPFYIGGIHSQRHIIYVLQCRVSTPSLFHGQSRVLKFQCLVNLNHYEMSKIKTVAMLLSLWYTFFSTVLVGSVDLMHDTQEVKLIWLTNWIVSVGVFACVSIWASKQLRCEGVKYSNTLTI